MTLSPYLARRPCGTFILLSLCGLCAATITPAQAQFTTVASFNNANGANPLAGVTLDSSGNLFGTAGGGAYGYGTVYEIAKGTSTITDIASFDGVGAGTNGGLPQAGVTFDKSGNLFGTTALGGATAMSHPNGYGTVYEIAKGSKTITTLTSFSSGEQYGGGNNGVTFDSSGNLFGTTSSGGTSGAGMVYKIAKGTNAITTVSSFNNANGAGPLAGVTFDSNGNLFGTTEVGGTSGAGTVYEIVKGTNTITTIASFNGNGAGTNGAYPYAGVTFDSSGNLFGTTYEGGASDRGAVYKIAKGTNTITDIASFDGLGAGTNGGTPLAGVTFDSSGDLFGTTEQGGAYGFGTVYEIAKGTNTITDIVSFNGEVAGTNGAYPRAGVTFDSSGDLFGTTEQGGAYGYGTVYEIVGAGSRPAAPEPSQLAALGLTTLGLGGLLLRARKRRQPATLGA